MRLRSPGPMAHGMQPATHKNEHGAFAAHQHTTLATLQAAPAPVGAECACGVERGLRVSWLRLFMHVYSHAAHSNEKTHITHTHTRSVESTHTHLYQTRLMINVEQLQILCPVNNRAGKPFAVTRQAARHGATRTQTKTGGQTQM